MVGRHHDSRDREGLRARRVGVGMVVGTVGDAVRVGNRGCVEEGRIVGVITALGSGWCRLRLGVEFGLCLSGLDLVQYAVSRVGRDALDLPLDAKLAVHERDVVELVDGECDGERGVSGEEVGEMSAEATRWRWAGRSGGGELDALGDVYSGGLDSGRAMSCRVGHGNKSTQQMSLLVRLAQIYQSIQSFGLPLPNLPIIDTAPPDNKDTLPGLRFLRNEVKRDCDVYI